MAEYLIKNGPAKMKAKYPDSIWQSDSGRAEKRLNLWVAGKPLINHQYRLIGWSKSEPRKPDYRSNQMQGDAEFGAVLIVACFLTHLGED